MRNKWVLLVFLFFIVVFGLSACGDSSVPENGQGSEVEERLEADLSLDKDGVYTSPQEVALYLQLYGVLPGNYLTKAQAKDLGWISQDGNLWEVTDQMSIGGDRFGNREGLLPKADGRQWYECDVNYQGGYRGAERLVFSNDGLVYYTEDHYDSFIEMGGAQSESD